MTGNTLSDRSFFERLRFAALTLWLPIMALALVPALVVAATASEELSWAVVTAGGVLLGGGLVYLVAVTASPHQEVYGLATAAVGATLLTLTSPEAPAYLYLLVIVADVLVRLVRRREKDGQAGKPER